MAAKRASTLLLFLNRAASIHAVTPRTPAPLTRRLINFCCNVPVPLFELDYPTRLAVEKKLESVPGAWRVSKPL